MLDLSFDVKSTNILSTVDTKNFEFRFTKIKFFDYYTFTTEKGNENPKWEDKWPKLEQENSNYLMSFRFNNKIFDEEKYKNDLSKNFVIPFYVNLEVPKESTAIKTFEINNRLIEINPIGGLFTYSKKGQSEYEPQIEKLELNPGNLDFILVDQNNTSLDIKRILYKIIDKDIDYDIDYKILILQSDYFEIYIQVLKNEQKYPNFPIKPVKGDLLIKYVFNNKRICEDKKINCGVYKNNTMNFSMQATQINDGTNNKFNINFYDSMTIMHYNFYENINDKNETNKYNFSQYPIYVSKVEKANTFSRIQYNSLEYKEDAKLILYSYIMFGKYVEPPQPKSVNSTNISDGIYSVTQNISDFNIFDTNKNTTIFNLRNMKIILFDTNNKTNSSYLPLENLNATLSNATKVNVTNSNKKNITAYKFNLYVFNLFKFEMFFDIEFFTEDSRISSFNRNFNINKGDMRIKLRINGFEKFLQEMKNTSIGFAFDLDHQKFVKHTESEIPPRQNFSSCEYENSEFLYSKRYLSDGSSVTTNPTYKINNEKVSTSYEFDFANAKSAIEWEAFLHPVKHNRFAPAEKDIIFRINKTNIYETSSNGNIEVKVNSTDGKSLDIFGIKLEKIEEVDGDGKIIESKENDIPFINSEETKFDTSLKESILDNINVTNFLLEKKLNGDLSMELIYLKSEGNITLLGDKIIPAKKDEMKFNFNLKNWKFCEKCIDNNGKNRTTQFVDIVLKLNPFEIGVYSNETNSIDYLSNSVYLSNKYDKDGEIAEMPENYPKINLNLTTITLRVSSDSRNVKYESFISSNALIPVPPAPEKESPLLVVIIIIILVLLLVVGILISCRSYSRKTSDIIERTGRFQDV